MKHIVLLCKTIAKKGHKETTGKVDVYCILCDFQQIKWKSVRKCNSVFPYTVLQKTSQAKLL